MSVSMAAEAHQVAIRILNSLGVGRAEIASNKGVGRAEITSNKRLRETSIDRLSALPDHLLIHILNLLGVKKAAITSVLSKRWKYLWTNLACLKFDNRRFRREDEETCRLVRLINQILLLRSENHLEKFAIRLWYDQSFDPDVNSWVEFAVKNKVKKLNLLLCGFQNYKLPQVIYSAAALTRLYMHRCIVAPCRTIEWKSLTELLIKDVKLDETVIEKILSGCPVLYRLVLSGCRGFNRLEVNSQSLYLLEIMCNGDEGGPLLEISAPYIRGLTVGAWPITSRNLRLTNVRSLVRATLNFLEPFISVGAIDLFQDIKHVKELKLGDVCIEVISLLVKAGWQLPQSTRRCLIIEPFKHHEGVISGIVGLLESSPYLETLVITDLEEAYKMEGRTWDPTATARLNRDLLQLKTVTITRYADPVLGGEPMLTMAQILLKRAPNLEKMIIDVEEYTKSSTSSDLKKVIEKVRSYPRSSQKAVVVFHQ